MELGGVINVRNRVAFSSERENDNMALSWLLSSPQALCFRLIGVTVSLLLSACSMSNSVAAGPAFERPNIILIVTDNQSPELLGAYGNAVIRTPNIDRIALEGIVFDAAHATSGVCSPSRATLMTGLIPSQTGVHNALPSRPSIDGWSAIREFRNLPMTMKTAGYRTGLVGKYHLGRHDKAQLGFDNWVTFPSGHTERFFGVEVIDNGERYVASEHLTDFWTQKAVEFVADVATSDEPFFLFLSYNGPYGLPPVVNAEYQNRHTKYYIDNPPSMPQRPVHQSLEAWATEGDPTTYSAKHGITPWTAINALNNLRAMANLAAETTMIDDGVGRVLDEVKAAGVSDNTIVIFTSDQGAAFGQKGLWGNSSWAWPFAAYEANSRVPLIVWDNGQKIDEGTRVQNIVNQYDIFPTILDLVGMSDIVVENSPGLSLLPIIDGRQTDSASGAAFFDYLTVRSVRTDQFRYIKRLLTGDTELYDRISDPEELNNLSGDPDYLEHRVQMDELLEGFFEEYASPKYDLWRGGSAKGRMLDGSRLDQYRDLFPGWDGMEMKHETAFDHTPSDNE